MRGEEIFVPSAQEIGAVFVEHVERLAKLLGNARCAVLHARKIAKYYARNLATRKAFCIAVNNCDDLSLFKKNFARNISCRTR
jgi:tRNA-dihydrouridine synthase B